MKFLSIRTSSVLATPCVSSIPTAKTIRFLKSPSSLSRSWTNFMNLLWLSIRIRVWQLPLTILWSQSRISLLITRQGYLRISRSWLIRQAMRRSDKHKRRRRRLWNKWMLRRTPISSSNRWTRFRRNRDLSALFAKKDTPRSQLKCSACMFSLRNLRYVKWARQGLAFSTLKATRQWRTQTSFISHATRMLQELTKIWRLLRKSGREQSSETSIQSVTIFSLSREEICEMKTMGLWSIASSKAR